ncbi:MAG: tetratricopeptide repeat protein [Chloroflexi bacterium]|nr:tetratricopeptide repeat protein [Chloroflexota bacterium]MBU1751072.1 tetratricopeptide repeat protein [Chloroflexota bacterium]
MTAQTRRIQPFRAHDGDAEPLLALARQSAPLLAPGWDPPADWLFDSRESEPWTYDRRTRRQGDARRGLEVIHYAGYEPRGGGQAVDRVTVTAYGLPDGASLRLECTRSWYDPRFLEVQASGPEQAVTAVLDAFQREFGGCPALLPEEVASELSSLRAALRVGDWAAVELRAGAILHVLPDEPAALFALGVARAAQDDLEAGERYLQAALARQPDHYDALYNLGLVYLARGEPARAVEALQRSLAIRPGNHPVLYQLGRALEAVGQTEEALAAYRDALRASPNPDGWHYTGLDFTREAKKAIRRLERL